MLDAWALSGPDISVTPIGTGHIHKSYRVASPGQAFFLQKLNSEVFPDPEILSSTLAKLGEVNFYGSVSSLPSFLPTIENKPYFTDNASEKWRLFPWISSLAESVNEELGNRVYRTAKAFGIWTATVNQAVKSQAIRPAIVGFHELPSIYSRFTEAWNNSTGSRKHQASETCARLAEGSFVLEIYHRLMRFLPKRIIHGDAKADNILLGVDQSWIVDLDTVMPGYLWMDVGDMIRSMACSLPESSDQLDEINIVPEVVEQILEGYGQGLGDLANPLEIESLRLGACCIIYEQALRFMTDFLAGDPYYPVSYHDENMVRAQNQLLLWESYVERYQSEIHNFLRG